MEQDLISYNQERAYLQLEREYIEKELMKKYSDIKGIVVKYYNDIQNNRGSNSNSRVYRSERLEFSRGFFPSGETENYIITKSNKKRIFKSV